MTDQLQVIVNRALANLHHTQESKRDIITRACEEWGALAVNAATDFWHRQNGEQRKELHELRQQLEVLTRENDERDEQEAELHSKMTKELQAQIAARKQAEADKKRLAEDIKRCVEYPENHISVEAMNFK